MERDLESEQNPKVHCIQSLEDRRKKQERGDPWRGERKQTVKLHCSMVEHTAGPRVFTLWWLSLVNKERQCGGEDNREGKTGKNKGRKFSRDNGQESSQMQEL